MKAGNADAESALDDYYPSCQKTSGIGNVRTSAINKTEYFDLDGRPIAAPRQGLCIRVEYLADGRIVTSKIIR